MSKITKYIIQYLLSCMFYSMFCVEVCLGDEPIKSYNKYIRQTGQNCSKLSKKLSKSNSKYLKKYFREENKLHKKLCKKNSALADRIFAYHADPLYYHQNNPESLNLPENSSGTSYFARFDTANISIRYFQNMQDSLLLDSAELQSTSQSINKLSEDIKYSESLKYYFRQRKLQLKQSLKKYPELSGSIKAIDKVNYYYQEEISELKELYSLPTRSEENIMDLLRGNKLFKQLLVSDGQLNRFNLVPSDWGIDIGDLQTMKAVNELKNMDIKSSGVDPKKIIEDKLQPMQESLKMLKSDFYGSTNNAADLPDFKPNPLKTKSLGQRLEFGSNYQCKQTTEYYPATIMFGLQTAYKLTPKIKPGVGISLSVGLGTGWDNIQFTQQGFGLRSFVDYELIKILFISYGYESNALPPSEPINSFHEINYNSWRWQQSMLLGLKIRTSQTARFVPTFSFQYDLLSNKHVPSTSPFVFRMGWELAK